MKPISQRQTIAEILELSLNPTLDEVKKNYKRLMKLYHPDVNQDPAACEYAKKLNQAYRFVLDREERTQPQAKYGQNQPVARVVVYYTFDNGGISFIVTFS